LTVARTFRASVALLGALATLVGSKPAAAQDDTFGPPLAPMGGMGGLGGGGKAPPKKAPPGTPELHAAPGGSESTLPAGAEPALPDEPLKMSPTVRERLGTDLQLDQRPLGLGHGPRYKWYGPYFEEQDGQYRFRTAVPLWAERRQPSLSDPTKTDLHPCSAACTTTGAAPSTRTTFSFQCSGIYATRRSPAERPSSAPS
jgi:hypothetical protein